MLIKTPYPKKGFRFTNDTKLTLLIVLWVLDKLVMGLMIWFLNWGLLQKAPERMSWLNTPKMKP